MSRRRRGGKEDWRAFEEAREFVRGLGLKNGREWQAYAKFGRKPDDIPSYPNEVYRNSGWRGMGDWLGTGNVKSGAIKWRSFTEAREFARGLGLTKNTDWVKYSKSDQKPGNIPATPREVYKHEWRGWGDWLGTGRRRGSGWRPFTEARQFARGLKLKTVREWEAYATSGQKPDDIPTLAYRVYKDEWRG